MPEQTRIADETSETKNQAENESAEQESKESGKGENGGESHQKNLERPSAEDIYEQVALNARNELKRSTLSLAISGFAGGIFMGLSGLGTALALGLFGHSSRTHFIASMFYPLGFIVVIIGRAQLFTENTLYPVALVLSEKRELWNTLRLWCTVLPANVLGALAFAALMARTNALQPATQQALIELGLTAAQRPGTAIFWSAVTAGWIIATAAWLVSGSHSITGSVIILWMLTYVVGLGSFAHCIATSGEILTSVLTGHYGSLGYIRWLALAVAGNVCGGVLMVTLLEYGQAVYGKADEQEAEEEA
ncbi:MAG TPA: formate/nitrite transporter family protein [Acidobacteriaceae bacterium]|nr:formate/nitrite transporter family protein [Acidobacteriaceae bacterium]